ncbi:hypothetical protein CFIMG_005131RAc [Ceratocystis fimbriata CBS 114723]|uniref:Uncharacterized protein n=1 Tax=Ceratocystis fimbriata CBS 114723 TaxID=1035309 RepID=A0A2C5X3V7_9PEZI|nr:hypothetical protein CFIMG_005131RAc [Ceratocystis fimbriata CBS 114723]
MSHGQGAFCSLPNYGRAVLAGMSRVGATDFASLVYSGATDSNVYRCNEINYTQEGNCSSSRTAIQCGTEEK